MLYEVITPPGGSVHIPFRSTVQYAWLPPLEKWTLKTTLSLRRNNFRIAYIIRSYTRATGFRTRTCLDLLEQVTPTVIRGNASEIMALAGDAVQTKGVDSSAVASDAGNAARALAEKYGCVVCVSGAVDLVTDRNNFV